MTIILLVSDNFRSTFRDKKLDVLWQILTQFFIILTDEFIYFSLVSTVNSLLNKTFFSLKFLTLCSDLLNDFRKKNGVLLTWARQCSYLIEPSLTLPLFCEVYALCLLSRISSNISNETLQSSSIVCYFLSIMNKTWISKEW